MNFTKRILSGDEVRQIRAEYTVIQTNARRATNIIELAKRYGVSQQLIRDVALGRKSGRVT